MTVVPFPTPADHVLSLVRDAYSKGNVLIPNPPNGGAWYNAVTHRQVNLCLAEGNLIGEPETDEHGNIRCTLERFGAGLMVRVHVALTQHEAKSWRIIVIKLENRL